MCHGLAYSVAIKQLGFALFQAKASHEHQRLVYEMNRGLRRSLELLHHSDIGVASIAAMPYRQTMGMRTSISRNDRPSHPILTHITRSRRQPLPLARHQPAQKPDVFRSPSVRPSNRSPDLIHPRIVTSLKCPFRLPRSVYPKIGTLRGLGTHLGTQIGCAAVGWRATVRNAKPV